MRNFATHFWKKFEEHKERVAFVEATADGVEPVTYWQWTRDVQKLALGLIDAGFAPGDRMAIVAPTRRSWLDLAFATWLVGGVVVPLNSGQARGETLRCLARAGAEWIAAESLSAIEELRGQGDKLPSHLKWIALEEARVGEPGPNTFELPTLLETGRDLARRGKLDKMAKRTYEIERDAPALILYPLVPGDDPHGAYFGGGKLAVILEALGGDLQLEEDARFAPLLSFGWFFGLLTTLAVVMHGRTVVLSERAGDLETRFNELQPTALVCGPAWIEGQMQRFRKRIEDAPQFLKNMDQKSGPLGIAKALSSLGERAARSVLYDPVVKELGGKLDRVYLAGGSAPDDILDVLDGAGIDVLGAWGLPECGISHVERSGAQRRHSVGRPVQGYVCKIADARAEESGEILIRADVLFDGYWDDEGPLTIEEGYLQTGVQGHVESGFLFVEK